MRVKSRINNVHCCLCSTPSLGRDQFAKSWFKKATYASWIAIAWGGWQEAGLSTDEMSEPLSLRQCWTWRLVDPSGELMPEYTAWEGSIDNMTTHNIQGWHETNLRLDFLSERLSTVRLCLICSTATEPKASHRTAKCSTIKQYP